MRRILSAWIFTGAIVFVLNASWADVLLTNAPLPGPTTGVSLWANEPFVSPFGKTKAKIVSGFGKRNVPGQPQAGQPATETHEGVDYAAFPGSAVRAARSGKVIFAGFSKMYTTRADKTQQNRFVIIRHIDGKSSRYVHLEALHIRPGQDVQSGQVLGMLAESDEWTEPVLHFEIRDAQGQPLNPESFITETTKLKAKN